MRKSLVLISLMITVGFLTLSITETEARQFRLMNPIATPEGVDSHLPAAAKPVEDVQPLSRQQVEPLLRKVIEQWNTGEMSATLSDQFYDKSRLMDVVNTGVPRDAKLRIQSIQGIQTLQQYLMPVDNGRHSLVSIVSATARTQLEFNSSTGLTRLPGTNEFILKVTQAAPP